MIVYPEGWDRDYSEYAHYDLTGIEVFLRGYLRSVLCGIDVPHLAYSGGIDSTVVLALLSKVHENVHTYTISSRDDHPDILFARKGSDFYGTTHHEFIVEPNIADTDKHLGDNVVRQFFESVKDYTDEIICCDGIDEFMCGYYDHTDTSYRTYEFYLGRLTADHLRPLNNVSNEVKVYLPYLDERLMNIYREIPLGCKVSGTERKKIMMRLAESLNVPDEITYRNKYGFCDAFREFDK